MTSENTDALLEEIRALRRHAEKADDRARDMLEYIQRLDVHCGGLDTKLRDVLSREATSSNIARDAYHQWLLTFDQAHRAKLVAAARGERLVNGTSTKALDEGAVRQFDAITGTEKL